MGFYSILLTADGMIKFESNSLREDMVSGILTYYKSTLFRLKYINLRLVLVNPITFFRPFIGQHQYSSLILRGH